jgi:hypothetical protein
VPLFDKTFYFMLKTKQIRLPAALQRWFEFHPWQSEQKIVNMYCFKGVTALINI